MTSVRCCLAFVIAFAFSCGQNTPLDHHSDSTPQPLSTPKPATGDLVLTTNTEADVVTFAHRDIPDDSCELYDGCALGSGHRDLIRIQVNVRNAGATAIDLGRPWESPYFHASLCQRTNTLYGFIQADLYDTEDALVVSGSLASNCVADRTGGFTCMAQGIAPGGTALQQPEGQCDYLDVTGVPAGTYRLHLTVNPSAEIPESNHDNNSVDILVEYPACAGVMCGGACCPDGVECRDGVCLLPDLRINAESAARSLWLSHETFEENSCELAEQCVSGSGRRRLLNFEGRIENWGPGDLSPGPERNNPLFEFSSCHQHYHFLDFSDYRLLDQTGAVVALGHKQSYCLMSMEPVDSPADPSPPGTRPEPETSGEVIEQVGGEPQGCNFLEAGWADIYGVGTPCQWVDVTDVPEGDYVLQLSVNPLGRVAESNVDNNSVQVPIHIPEDAPCVPQPEICGDAIDQDCDDTPDIWDRDCQTPCNPSDPFCEAPTTVAGNDSCAAAFELSDSGVFSGTLAVQPAASPAACGGSGPAAYFRFELDREQVVYLGALGSAVDTVIALYPAGSDCGAEPSQCADDDCDSRNGHLAKLLAAGTYIAVVRGKSSMATGRYSFRYQHADAAGARVIEHPGVYAADTTNSGDDVQACADWFEQATGDGPDDVYVLARCNASVTVSTCGSTTFSTVLEARTLDPSDWEEPIQCDAARLGQCESDPLGAVLTTYSQSDGLMFVTVDGVAAADFGEYQISFAF